MHEVYAALSMSMMKHRARGCHGQQSEDEFYASFREPWWTRLSKFVARYQDEKRIGLGPFDPSSIDGTSRAQTGCLECEKAQALARK